MNWMALRAIGLVSGLFLSLGALRTHPDASGAILTPPPAPIIVPDPTTTTMPQRTTTETRPPATVATCQDALDLAAQVGWPEDELDTLGVVLLRESNCTPSAHNTQDPNGGSYGLTQINGFWCVPNTYWPIGWLQAQHIIDQCSDLFIPENNLRAALAIWENSGWAPWRTAN